MGCEARESKGSPEPEVATKGLVEVVRVETPPVRVSQLDLGQTLYVNLSRAPAADPGQAYRNMVSAGATRNAIAGSRGAKNVA